MIGIILLFISIYLYFRPKYRYISYFLYFGFMRNGFNLWADSVLGIKTGDCAVVYTFVISLYLLSKGRWRIPRIKGYGILITFISFLILSMLFSYAYYGLSLYQIVQGGRDFLLIFSLPILIQAESEEVRKVFKLLFWTCLLTSVLYILQILVVKGPIMPYAGEPSIDPYTGLVRMYNSPIFLNIFLVLSFLCPQFFPKKININLVRCLLFVALICTLGRTNIMSNLFLVLLALMLNGNFKRMGKAITIIGILFLPFIDTISQRFEKGGTSNDLEEIMKGNFNENYDNQKDATMLYRFAWCYERADYLAQRPIGEKIFGMGLCSDSQDWVYRHYGFRIGLTNEENMRVAQLTTPDISIGNLITRLGFGGMAIYLAFYASLVLFFWKYRKCNILFLLMSAYSLILIVGAFSSSVLSETKTLSLMFFIMSLAFHPNGKGLMKFDYSKKQ